MYKIAVITTAFGNGLADREQEYRALASTLGLSIWYCTREELIAKPEGIEGVIVGVEKADASLFACPDLRVAMKFGVGMDNFDREAAKAAGVTIFNMPGINSAAVAEIAMTLLLAVSREIVPMANSIRNGAIAQSCSHSIFDKKLGIIGMGGIGKRVALLARAFGMECLGYDIAPIEVEHVRMTDLATLLKESDAISVHIPLTESTYHLIGEEAFAQMKEGVIVVNTSRGGVVDDEALYRRLVEGHVGGAGLDVFESNEIAMKLAQLDSVICTPHVAAYTHETLRFMENTALRRIQACLAGEEYKNS